MLYKVKITRDTIVDAKNEEEAKDLAYDSMIMGDVDFVVEEDKPEAGKTYALTGARGSRCIANGNSWAESEVKDPAAQDQDAEKDEELS